MQKLVSDLIDAQVGDILQNEPMTKHTTWRIGGPADVLVVPKGKRELVEVMRIIYGHAAPWIAIGKGSNTLVSDKGIRGVVIKLGNELNNVEVEGDIVRVGGAVPLTKLAAIAGKHGLTGLEFAAGIPGTIGGAVYMNAGAHGSDVSRVLRSAEILLETGEMVNYEPKDLQFAYRYSSLQEKSGIVTEATFQLAYGDRTEIGAVTMKLRKHRVKTQPLQLACAGSVFRNPVDNYAAKLIEQAGLKGHRVGQAEVSTLHANFIVNTGQATATDVLTLMEQIQATVYEKFDVTLVPEVLQVGEP